MTALQCFNEFETRRLCETSIHLEEDEVLINSIYPLFFVTNLKNVGSLFLRKERKLHSTPVHIQTRGFGNRLERSGNFI